MFNLNRKLAHAYAGGVMHGICNGGGDSGQANLTDSARAHFVDFFTKSVPAFRRPGVFPVVPERLCERRRVAR